MRPISEFFSEDKMTKVNRVYLHSCKAYDMPSWYQNKVLTAVFHINHIVFSELTIILARCFSAQYIILNFGKTVTDRLLCAKNTAASGFPFDMRVKRRSGRFCCL